MATFYAAYEIAPETRQMLIDTFMPKYPEVVAHHITYKYGAEPAEVPEAPQQARVVGYHDSGAIQVLVVDIDGNRHQAAREDGSRKLLHITFALDRAQGVSPSKSNAFLEKIVAEKGFDALCNLSDPIDIEVTPKLILDPPEHHEAEAEAKKTLAQKSDGPNGLLAYALVNDLRVRPDGTTEPFFNKDSSQPLELAYAFFETDRVGVPVISAPGGTQDIHLSHKATGQRFTIELTKEKSLRAALDVVGLPQPDDLSIAALELHTLTELIKLGFDADIETPWVAAIREAREEQGIDLAAADVAYSDPIPFTRQAITKRSLDDLRDPQLLSLENIQDLDSVKARLALMRGLGAAAPKENTQHLFAVQVDSFSTVKPSYSGPKVENKIPGRTGATFREKGVFATLADMERLLEAALPRAKHEVAQGNPKAAQEIFATYERLEIFKGIEAHLVQHLAEQGVQVQTTARADQALLPDITDAPAPDAAAVTPPGNAPRASAARYGRK